MASQLMHMVSDTQYAADGVTVTYGAGELHDPGTLPAGVPYREIVAGDAFRETAPAHAPRPEPEPEPVPEPKAAEKQPAAKMAAKA